MAELVYAHDLKSCLARDVGSIPTPGTWKILYKLPPGYHVDQVTGAVFYDEKDLGDDQATLFERLFKARFIGISPHQIHRYRINYTRLQKADDEEMNRLTQSTDVYDLRDANLGVVYRSTLTDYHAWQETYAIIAKELETRDHGSMTIVGTVETMTYNALTPVFTFRGNWFEYLSAAIESSISKYVKRFTLKEWREGRPVNGGDETIGTVDHYRELSAQVVRDTKGTQVQGQTAEGERQPIGVSVIDFQLARWQAPDDIEAAAREQIRKKMIAAGRIEEATGEAEAIRLKGEANADAARKLMEATLGVRGGVNLAIARELSGAIFEAKPRSLYLGQSLLPTVNVNEGEEQPGQPSPAPNPPQPPQG
jgi:hypothetical protein